MQIFYFLMFIAACAVVLIWAMGRSRKETDLAGHKTTVKKKQHTDRLSTPSDHLLSHRNQVWHNRRHKVAEDVSMTNRYAPRSLSAGEAEYDGYSRRDRHHVAAQKVHVKKEGHAEELSMTSMRFKRGEHTA
jgi:hypothetical protein